MSRAVAESWLEAFRQKDIHQLNLAEDFVHYSPFGEVRSRDTYLDLVRSNEAAFFSPELTVLDIIDGGPTIAVRYLVNGNPACDVIYVQDGQIVEIYSYYHVGEKPAY
jgi:hypothetical protein